MPTFNRVGEGGLIAMEPISFVGTAIALGAAAGLKPTVEQAVKDAYAGLKALIVRRYQKVDIGQLEANPNSKPRREVVEEDLAKAGAEKDVELLGKAKELVEIIGKQAPETARAIGVD